MKAIKPFRLFHARSAAAWHAYPNKLRSSVKVGSRTASQNLPLEARKVLVSKLGLLNSDQSRPKELNEIPNLVAKRLERGEHLGL